MEDIILFLVPISMFAAIAVVLGLLLHYMHRNKAETQQTLRAAVQQGQQLTPELMAVLGEPVSTAKADLRRGVIAIAIGLGIAALGLLGGDEIYEKWTIVGIGAMPTIIGLAYLGLWRFSPRK